MCLISESKSVQQSCQHVAYRFISCAFVLSPFSESPRHHNQNLSSSFFSEEGFLPAKAAPGISSSDGKADVILRYNPDEARSLKAYGELPESVKVNDTVIFGGDGEEDEIQFDDLEDDGEEEADIDAI